jgi:hypothetical protein
MYLDTLTSLPEWLRSEPVLVENLDKVPVPVSELDPGETVLYPAGTYDVKTFNSIKYIQARTGDTPRILASELDMMPWQIVRYNDIDEKYVFRTGERVYLQPKRNKGSDKFHTLKAGENLRDISQLYGVKLKRLYKYNNLKPGQLPPTGSQINLRKKAR